MLIVRMSEWLAAGARLLAAVLSLGCSSAALASTSVEVTGEGPTRYDAQMDALRQALQAVVRQLVIADREIREDQITLDRIYSSFNGYIEGFSILRESREGSTSRMLVRLTVSEAPIAELLRRQNPSGPASMAGGALSAEISRERENRRFRDRLLTRALQGYPHAAVAISVLSARPDRANPQRVYMDVEYRLNPAFLAGLRNTVQTLSCKPNDPNDACPALVCFSGAAGLPSTAPAIWPRGGILGMKPQSQCYRLPAGPAPSMEGAPGGYSILKQFVRPAMQYDWPENEKGPRDFVMAALYLGADGQRLENNASRCIDGAFRVRPLIFAGPISTQSMQQVLWIAEHPEAVTLEYDFTKDLDRLGKLDAIELIPTVAVGRQLYADSLSAIGGAAGGVTTAFRPELGLNGGCFN